MLTVYFMAFNEEDILQFTIDHYRNRFPNCQFVIYDNDSTDKTKDIALKNNCQVINFNTNNEIDEEKITNLKNNCWKTATTNWVCVCDPDELVDINEKQLLLEEQKSTTIIKTEGYNMVNMKDNFDFKSIKHGYRFDPYDKSCIFNKKYIEEINYLHGCHKHRAIGQIKLSDKIYKLLHYRYINIESFVNRAKYTAKRLSEKNKKMGCGTGWLTSEENFRKNFYEARSMAKQILI